MHPPIIAAFLGFRAPCSGFCGVLERRTGKPATTLSLPFKTAPRALGPCGQPRAASNDIYIVLILRKCD